MKKIKDSTMGKVRMLSKEQMKKLRGGGVDPDPIGGCYVIGTKCSVNNQQQCCSTQHKVLSLVVNTESRRGCALLNQGSSSPVLI